MSLKKIILFLILLVQYVGSYAQDNEENYITFNDRRNVVHGVYVGYTLGYGEIAGKNTYTTGLKIAYVANRQFEAGFLAKVLYSRQNAFNPKAMKNEDLIGGYAGFHLEPIFFGKSRISLSFPVFIGGGAVGFVSRKAVDNNEEVELEESYVDAVFVLEPGVSALFNISRYLQIEAGVKYRFSSKIELVESPIDRINGFSTEIGIKLGIFNMGRNRYKKQLD